MPKAPYNYAVGLKEYRRKRKFNQTPEPRGDKVPAKARGDLRFVVQLHSATKLHYDFRIEFGGVFRSWAVPKGPSLNPMDQRLAVFVEDHPLDYGSFEGVIPRGNYGAGTVLLWDEGTFVERGSTNRAQSERALPAAFAKGHITMVLQGKKLRGEFALIRLKKEEEKIWLLVKKRDAFSDHRRTALAMESVKTGRSLEEIARESEARGDVWLPKRRAGEGTTQARSRPPARALPVRAMPDLRSRPKPPPAPPRKRPAPKAPGTKKFAIDRASTTDRFPRGVRPAMPRLRTAAPESATGWSFVALRAGGIRALAEIENGHAKIYSRARLSLNGKYPALARALGSLPHPALVDGEIVENVFYAFDLLYLDGRDLRPFP